MVTRRSETAGTAFCMKGTEQTTSQMTAVHCDQRDVRVSPLGCGESQSDSVGGVQSWGRGMRGWCSWRFCQISWLVAVDSRHLLPVFRSNTRGAPFQDTFVSCWLWTWGCHLHYQRLLDSLKYHAARPVWTSIPSH